MGAAAPWSVKGIDPKAREVAKDLARRSGMTLGEWLNRVILEDDAVPAPASNEPGRAAAQPAPGEVGRLVTALDRLTDRIEASETRTGLAIAGVEHSVRHAVARIDNVERGQDVTRRGERPARAEAPAGPRSAAALRMLSAGREDAPAADPGDPQDLLDRLGRRLADAETRTVELLEALRGSLAALDQRLAAVEGGGDMDRRLETLGAALAQQVDAARETFADQLKSAALSEERLADMAAYVDAAERRSAQAIGVLGREVVSMAEALNRRLQASEQRSAAAIEKVGGEVTGIAGAVESRLGRAEQTQVAALDKLGVEMSRMTERLTERLLGSERRAAQAIDDVGEQMSRVTERFERRQERAATDLAERIRLSEERTAQLLEDSRHRWGALAPGPASAAAPPFAAPLLGAESQAASPVGQPLAEDEDPAPFLVREKFDANEAFAPIPELDEDDRPLPFARVEEEADGERPLSTREVIDQARAAARAAQGPRLSEPSDDRRATAGRRGLFGGGFKPRRPNSTLQTALMVAGGAVFLSVGAAGVVLLEGPPPAQVAQVEISPPRAAVAIAPASSVPVSRAAAAPAQAEPAGPAHRYAEALDALKAKKPGALAALKAIAEADYAPAQLFLAKLYETGEAGVVVNPGQARLWAARAAEGGDAAAMHQLAIYHFRGEGGPSSQAAAATWFRKAAERGVVDSQYNLALLYRSGAGVERNLAEAYRWFSVAAAAGDATSRAAAQELRGRLTPTELAGADQAAARLDLSRR